MKKFLVQVCWFSLSLIVLSICFEISLRRIPNSYKFKRQLIEKNENRIKHLIIGSSVSNCGIQPAYLADSTYNLSLSRQWLRYNLAFLEKYIDRLPHLKTVIWGISYQSLWTDDSSQTDKTSMACHKIYMGIDAEHNLLDNSELIATGSFAFRKWSKYYLRHKKTMNCDSVGVDHSYDLSEKGREWLDDIPRMSKGHTLYRKSGAEKLFRDNMNRLNKGAKLCHDRGIKLYLVLPPVYKEYYEHTDARQDSLLYAALEEMASRWNNVRSFNYLEDARFEADDFFNGNHLTSDGGAAKFTEILKEDIGTID